MGLAPTGSDPFGNRGFEREVLNDNTKGDSWPLVNPK